MKWIDIVREMIVFYLKLTKKNGCYNDKTSKTVVVDESLFFKRNYNRVSILDEHGNCSVNAGQLNV
jgi:hypothetical protein